MGLFKHVVIGGAIGSLQEAYEAHNKWSNKKMLEENAWGHPHFRQRLEQDWPVTQQDIGRWNAMGGVKTKEGFFCFSVLFFSFKEVARLLLKKYLRIF